MLYSFLNPIYFLTGLNYQKVNMNGKLNIKGKENFL